MKFGVSDVEEQQAKDWQDAHPDHCSEFPEHAPKFYYKLIPTGIGTGVKVGCSMCGREFEVTDVSTW